MNLISEPLKIKPKEPKTTSELRQEFRKAKYDEAKEKKFTYFTSILEGPITSHVLLDYDSFTESFACSTRQSGAFEINLFNGDITIKVDPRKYLTGGEEVYIRYRLDDGPINTYRTILRSYSREGYELIFPKRLFKDANKVDIRYLGGITKQFYTESVRSFVDAFYLCNYPNYPIGQLDRWEERN